MFLFQNNVKYISQYLVELILATRQGYMIRHKNSDNLDSNTQNSECTLAFVRPSANSIFKARLPPFQKGYISCLIESLLEMMKNAFYFILKVLFVLKIFNFFFFTIFWSCRKKGLIKLISKFTTSQPGLQTTEMHIFPNISQSKDNQTIKIGQLIEYITRDTFFFKNYVKMRWGD